MIIAHICLANFFVEKMAYQENLLTKYHAKEHDVYVITSDYSFEPSGETCKKTEKEYKNEYGVCVKVLDRGFRYGFYSKYGDYERLYETLSEIKPDIIFCHGGQFIALKDVIAYCKKHIGVKLFIDQHGDYYNTPVNTFRKRMGQYLVYGHWMRKAVKYTSVFWGVTPWRCRYLHDVYGIPKKKIAFLPMGGDDEKIHFEESNKIKKDIREKYNIEYNDFLVITGGKIDENKNIHLLIEAIRQIDRSNVKLMIFGQPAKNFENEFKSLVENSHAVRYIGWIPSDAVYDYYLASDICFFPGTHSVLWEQACACGLPGVFKNWDGMHHVDVGGNALFIKGDDLEAIKSTLLDIVDNPDKLHKMRTVAKEKGIATFAYSRISKMAILEQVQCEES